jgi:hypothetical protein
MKMKMNEQDQTKTEGGGAADSSAWLEPLRNQLRVQGEHGNWNYNSYMLGMFNGLECALATLERREPQYRQKPNDGWFDDRISPGFVPTVCDWSND